MAIRLSLPLSLSSTGAGTTAGMDPWQPAAAPMTAAQRSLLKQLCARMNLPFDPRLSKQQALQRITELRRIDPTARAPADQSMAGEEDPGASLGDEEVRDALQQEKRAAGARPVPPR
jgi:antitoxin component of RelBE/YafQ-DinJ toxin-antitoxin module